MKYNISILLLQVNKQSIMYRDYAKGRITNKTVKYIPLVQYNKTIKYYKDTAKPTRRNSKNQRNEMNSLITSY